MDEDLQRAYLQIKKLWAEAPEIVDIEELAEIIRTASKVCRCCNKEKHKSQFYLSKQPKDGYDYYCKECRNDKTVEGHAKNPRRCGLTECTKPHYANGYCKSHNARVARNGHPEPTTTIRDKRVIENAAKTMWLYNVDFEWYEKKLDKGCDICGKSNKEWYGLHIEHDHSCCNSNKSCGKCIRGVVCASCNTTLMHYDRGTIRKNNKMIPAIERYLNEYKSRR